MKNLLLKGGVFVPWCFKNLNQLNQLLYLLETCCTYTDFLDTPKSTKLN